VNGEIMLVSVIERSAGAAVLRTRAVDVSLWEAVLMALTETAQSCSSNVLTLGGRQGSG